MVTTTAKANKPTDIIVKDGLAESVYSDNTIIYVTAVDDDKVTGIVIHSNKYPLGNFRLNASIKDYVSFHGEVTIKSE